MRIKRLTALVLSLIVAASLTACQQVYPEGTGSAQEPAPTVAPETTAVTVEEEAKPEPAVAETAEPTEEPAATEAVQETTGPKDVYVDNAKDLLAAIASDTTIHLAPGTYNVTDCLTMSSYDYGDILDLRDPYVGSLYEYDGYELEIVNIKNLTLVCDDLANPAAIVCEPRYSDVMHFVNCNNLSFANLVCGHTPDRGSCVGSVLSFDYCRDIVMSGMDLYGCGTYGIETNKTSNFLCRMSKIHDCSYGLMTIDNSKNITFEDCNFTYDEGYCQVECYRSQLTIYDSTFMDLNSNTVLASPDYESVLTFSGCVFDPVSYASLTSEDNANIVVIN